MSGRGRSGRAPRLAAVAVIGLTLVASGCSGSEDQDGAAPQASASSNPPSSPPDPSASPSPAETLDPDVIARATAVQAAQQALGETGRGTFTVELVRGLPAGVLPTVEGAYDFTVPSGRFTARTEEPGRTVTLRYRTRGGLAWSQVLYPGSPLAPDCWYQLEIEQGGVALPSQAAALLYLRPGPDPDADTAVAELGDVLNAVGLTRLANLLTVDAAATPTTVDVLLRGEGDDARFTGWTVDGQDVLDAVGEADLAPGGPGELAAVRSAVAAATWRITLVDAEESGGSVGTRPPPPDRLLVAGRRCT
ncbi:hypothetical protein KLP28_02145 [Nocardioidaceae bacterium]|nr:hypothetical protein KLP28_02145 [Nocardioidaceae bacterium]